MFKKIKKVSKTINRKVTKIQVNILLTIIYFVTVTPLGLLKNLLKKTNSQDTYWKKVSVVSLKIEDHYKQY